MIGHVRFRLRLLARHPGLAGTATVLLALGISAAGVGHDIFSAVVSPRVRGGERIARVGLSSPVGLSGVGPLPAGLVEEIAAATTCFTRLVAVASARAWLTDETGTTVEARVAAVTPGFLGMVDVSPVVGRGFVEEDHSLGAPGTLVLSDGLWKRLYERDRSVIGRSVTVDGRPLIVIGVMPKGERFPMADAWSALPRDRPSADDGGPISLFAQLREDRSWVSARAEFAAAAPRIAARHPDLLRDRRLRLLTLSEEGRSRLGVAAFGAIGPPLLLLLLSCFTVGNLAVAEAVGRERELATRMALGASRARLARQLGSEGMVLALPSGLLAVGLMNLELWLVRLAAPPPLQWFTDSLTTQLPTLVFVAAITALTPFVFGLAPFVGVLRGGVDAGLRQTWRAPLPGLGRYTVRELLVTLQVALAIVVVASFSLLRGIVVSAADPEAGFDQDGVFVVRTTFPGSPSRATEERGDLDADSAVDRLASLPAVEAAAAADAVPRWSRPNVTVVPIGSTLRVRARRLAVGRGYFPVLGVGLLEGRDLAASDSLADDPVAVVSESLSQGLWSGQRPLGRSIQLVDHQGPPTTVRIVGVVPDLTYGRLDPASRRVLYVPLAPHPPVGADRYVLLRTAGPQPSLTTAVTSTLRDSLAVGTRVLPPRPLSDVAGESFADSLFLLDLLGSVGLLTLALALGGVAGMTVEAVRLHKRELGIRAALGALPGDLIGLVLRRTSTTLALGTVLGLFGPLVYHLSHSLGGPSSRWALVQPGAWAVIGSSVLLMLTAAALAARRAGRADPAVVMRAE